MVTLTQALAYRNAGLCVIPARPNKAPAVKWELYQKRLPIDQEIEGWFGNNGVPLGLVCGNVSGGLEVIDFDLKGAMFADWQSMVESTTPGLLARLVIERSPSGGFHVFYKCAVVDGNTKLASKIIDEKQKCGIETRGEGGFIVCAPTLNYVLIQGRIETIPLISNEERETLITSARLLNEIIEPAQIPTPKTETPRQPGDVSPMEDFNARSNVFDLLTAVGWKDAGKKGKYHHLTRPGKQSGPSGAVIDGKVFHCFTSNAPPFEPSKSYSPFAVEAILRHNGCFSTTAKALFKEGYGSRKKPVASEPPPPTDDDYVPEPPVDYVDDYSAQQPPPRNWIIEDATSIFAEPPTRPEELISGVVFRGGKMYLSAPSKARKTFWQMNLGVCIASGRDWFDHKVSRGKVLYINFELNKWSFYNRLVAITKMLEVTLEPGLFNVLHLRGQKATIEDIENFVLPDAGYSVIVFDPLYKMLGNRNENAAGEMGDLFNRIEAIANRTNATVVVAHHFSKGNAAEKSAIDRGSGSGVSARDGDALVVLTPHETDDCFTMEMVLRDFPPQEQQVLRWTYPLFSVDNSLDPEKLKTSNTTAIPITNDDVIACTPKAGDTRENIITALKKLTGRGENSCRQAVKRTIDGDLLTGVHVKKEGRRDIIIYKETVIDGVL